MNTNDVLIRPIISEKTTEMMEINKYVFEVAMNSNKLMVRQAVKKLFGVQPERVNVMRVRGKRKRIRYQYGKTAAWKKAIVTLKEGDKIDIYDVK